ncbi:MAG: cupin domain-containing protein [Acidobacteria bacterium]|nr:cupin domain-containing protein [Acidobacteriota bacterium]
MYVRIPVAVTLFAALTVGAAAQTPKKAPPAAPPAHHTVVTAADLKWQPAPPSLPAGAEAAVISGDPMQAGPFVIRLKFPDGYTVPPHFHPTTENVTVLSGSLAVGTGDTLDAAAAKVLGPGDIVMMPKAMHHFAMAKAATTIQVHATGPFAITYINPNDDPRKKTTTDAK